MKKVTGNKILKNSLFENVKLFEFFFLNFKFLRPCQKSFSISCAVIGILILNHPF